MSGDRLPEKLRVDKSLQKKKKEKQCAHILAKTHCQNCLKVWSSPPKKNTTNWRDRRKLYNNNLKNLHNKSKQLPMDGVWALNFHHQLLTDNSAAEEKQKHQKNRGEREELGREEGKEKLNFWLAESEQLLLLLLLLTCWLRLVAVNTECTWMCRVTSSWYPRKQVHYEGHWELAAHHTMPVLHPLETHTISFPMSIIVTKNPSFFGPSSPKSQTGCVVCSHQETNATSKQTKWCQNL